MLSCGFNKEKKVFWLSHCSRAKLYYWYNLDVKISRDPLSEHTGSAGLRITNPKHRIASEPSSATQQLFALVLSSDINAAN